MKFSAALTISFIAALAKATTDFDALNYALTLEYIEADYYRQGLAAFGASAFSAAAAPYNDPYLYPNMVLIGGHENSHVTYLKNTITALGGTPIAPCASYNFGSALASVASFVNNAYGFETLGVQAYDGAVGAIAHANIQQAAATIATIEARHANFLASYASATFPQGTGSGNSVPNGNTASFDNAATPASVASQISSYVATCTPTLPVLRTAPSNYATALTVGTPAVTLSANDVNTLRYAMFLENFEKAFYMYYIGTSGTPGTLGASGGAFSASELSALRLVLGHETDHVAFLNAALGTSAVAACSSYTFDSTWTRATFLANAAAIEAAGVTAYDGAINAITSPAFANAAATIATVEARHADYLTTLAAANNQNHFTTTAFDSVNTPAQVVAVVQSLNMVPASCFAGITLPVKATSDLSKSSASSIKAAVPTVLAAAAVAAMAVMF